MKQKFYYLISIQFLGFRYSGWQKQLNAKTVQGMVDKTFRCIFKHKNFKTLGAGRTDAKVSANEFFFELFLKEPFDPKELYILLEKNLPPDIKVLTVRPVQESFNVINDTKIKEYLYIFTKQVDIHPFCSPFMVSFKRDLDIDLMRQGAKLFEGKHNFQKYCYKPSEQTVFQREVLLSEVVLNDIHQASFFPEKSWIYRVQAKGFMRHQVRLMMGCLVFLGEKKINQDEVRLSLKGGDNIHLAPMVPASGLSLNKLIYKE